MGKLSSQELRSLLACIKKNKQVIVPPMVGYDSGAHLIGDKYLVVSTDPCIGVPEEWFGWLLINYAASDVALFGAKPEFCTINLLAPTGAKPELLLKTMKQACKAAEGLQIAIVTGHTGTYEGVSKLVGVCTAYGTIKKQELITPAGTKPGDLIFVVKPVALETIVNFALLRKSLAAKLFGEKRTREIARLVPMQSCVKEALLLANLEDVDVHAMHDATEGGLVSALNEMADSADLGFNTDYDRIPFQREACSLEKHFKLSSQQVLSMSSTGTFLASVSPETKDAVMICLDQNGVSNSIIGSFTKDKRRTLTINGKAERFPRKVSDPYDKILRVKA